MTRIYIPLKNLQNNPYEPTTRLADKEDIKRFAIEEILPFAQTRPTTFGLQVLPQIRLLNKQKQLIGPEEITTIATAAKSPPADTKEKAELTNVWKLAIAQLIFGHRRTHALRYLHAQALAFETSLPNIFDELNTPRAIITLYTNALFIPVDVVQLDDKQMLSEVYGENAFRKQTAAMEDVEYIRHAFTILPETATLKDAADLLNISHSRIRTLWALRDISPELAAANIDGRLSTGHLEKLKTVERIAQNTAGSDWGEDPTHYAPIHPKKYIELVLQSDTITRKDIRDYLTRIASYIAKPIDQIKHIEIDTLHALKATCARCPAQYQNKCLNLNCWVSKRRHHLKQYAQENLPNIPWSDDPEHFEKPLQHHNRQTLETITQNPENPRHKNLVIGINPARTYGINPFNLSHDYPVANSFNGEKALTYGYSGSLSDLEKEDTSTTSNQTASSQPTAPLLDITLYQNAAEEVANRIRNRYATALADAVIKSGMKETAILDMFIYKTIGINKEPTPSDTNIQRLNKYCQQVTPHFDNHLKTLYDCHFFADGKISPFWITDDEWSICAIWYLLQPSSHNWRPDWVDETIQHIYPNVMDDQTQTDLKNLCQRRGIKLPQLEEVTA